MRAKVALLVVFSVVTVLTSGCNGARDTDQYAYVLAIGLDKGPEGMMLVTYQLAIPQALGGGGESAGPKGDGKSFVNTSVIAPSLAEARNLANAYVARAISFLHLKGIIIGEDLAVEGVGDALAPIMRYREYRGSMFVMVARGTARNFLEANKPKLDVVPSKHYEMMFSTAIETGYFLRTNIHELYNGLKNGGVSAFATLVAPNKSELAGGPRQGYKSPGEKADEFLAGDIPREGEKLVSYNGLAIFRGDKLVGKLTNEETRMLVILRDEFHGGFIVLADPLDPRRFVNINVRLGSRPKIDVNMVDGHPAIAVDVYLEGDITAIPSGTNYEQDDYRELLEAQLSQVVKADMLKMLEYTKERGSDVAGFGLRMRTKVNTNKDFQNMDWFNLYQHSKFKVSVTTRLRRSGLMRKTLPILS